MSRLQFQLEAQASHSNARACRFKTLHNEVTTPIFMPVGTQATVKSQNLESLTEIGPQILLANTYHLLLRPGKEVFEKLGGIHPFMKWNKSVLTDSGGFQIFSLPHSREMSDEGALFRSYVDGELILLSPEVSIGMQKAIGSDIMMVLDQCVPSTVEHSVALEAMTKTHRWAKRSLAARGDSLQSMFAIIQGACFEDLRKQSADFLTQMPFDGFAIGGLAVGEGKTLRDDFTELSAQLLPQNLPRYLMGVGTPIDILEAVHRGVDMFDCILPTALAQRGVAFTSQGKMQLRRSVYKFSEEGLDLSCACKVCRTYSKAYLHHLVKTEENLGWYLIGFHNLYFYHQLMNEMRQHILADTFYSYYLSKKDALQQADPEFPVSIAKKRKSKKSEQLSLGDYEIATSAQGFYAIRQKSSGEVMHSVNQPEEEAQKLYIEQSEFKTKITENITSELLVWDVGLGAATNAMAVIQTYEKTARDRKLLGEAIRPVHLVSFERDLDPLRLALKYNHFFTFLRHSAPSSILQNKRWESNEFPLQWSLIQGDFLTEFAQCPAPDLIFYDPFSAKTDTALWSWSTFQKLFQHCAKSSTELYTYSASTRVRAGLIGAGFQVAHGVGTGPKSETTIAYTEKAFDPDKHRSLGLAWLERWQRSDSQYPDGLALQDQEKFRQLLVESVQLLPLKRERSDGQKNQTHQG